MHVNSITYLISRILAIIVDISHDFGTFWCMQFCTPYSHAKPCAVDIIHHFLRFYSICLISSCQHHVQDSLFSIFMFFRYQFHVRFMTQIQLLFIHFNFQTKLIDLDLFILIFQKHMSICQHTDISKLKWPLYIGQHVLPL